MAEVQATKINQEELIRKVGDLEKRLETKDAEIQVYKMLVSQMEEEAAQAKKYKALHEKQTEDVDFLRTESEKTLTKAKSMIFEKTKVIKNQELQIEAFTQQIESLREVIRITKDLLEIRNLEVQQLEIKISSMEGKQKAEKERYDLMHKKLEMMIRHNAELKREYETQLCLFTALRDRYNERELAKDVVGNLKRDKNADNKNLEAAIVVNNENQPGNLPEQNLVEDNTNTVDNNVDSVNTDMNSPEVTNQQHPEELKQPPAEILVQNTPSDEVVADIQHSNEVNNEQIDNTEQKKE
ncbi:girdin [Diorhabda carinulata]|uniref:girdin n=1 Tax=Diorhabda carinulata TaxID=1163345 RepID=UPI0025A1CC79|nr:girdin [Diorhabda carinulata]